MKAEHTKIAIDINIEGCCNGNDSGPSEPPPPSSGEPILVDLDTFAEPFSLEIAVGDEVLLQGSENPGTAFMWFLKEDDHFEIVSDVDEEGNQNAPPGGFINTRKITIKALTAGDIEI